MLTPEQFERIRQLRDIEANRPLIVAVMGQTGVGKSTLVNALFGTNLETGSVAPVTKAPQKVELPNNSNSPQLIFWDLPGIGESVEKDNVYISEYIRIGQDADVVLWACHADSRSVSLEISTLNVLLQRLDIPARTTFLSKIAFVLTKADLVTPEPWIAAKFRQYTTFSAAQKTRDLLNEKSKYFRDVLLGPFQEYLLTRTLHNGKFKSSNNSLYSDENYVYYKGIVNEAIHSQLNALYPRDQEVIERLYQNTAVTYCSARLRFNLALLVRVIAERINPAANHRFRKFIDFDTLDQVAWDKAKSFSNLVVYDQIRKRIIFDISKMR